jgi:hypothetical protein
MNGNRSGTSAGNTPNNVRDAAPVSQSPGDRALSGDNLEALLARVEGVRRALARVAHARVVLQALGAGLASWLLITLSLRALGIDAADVARNRAVPLFTSVFVAIVCAVMLWRTRREVSPVRAALWIEEHGDIGFALVTWVEQTLAGERPSALLASRVARASAPGIASAQSALRPLARAQLGGPLVFLIGAVLVLTLTERTARLIQSTRETRAAGADSRSERREVAIGAWRIRITPPAYSGLPSRSLGDTNVVRALSGTRIEVLGEDALPDSVVVRALNDSSAPARPAAVERISGGWRSAVIADERPAEVRVRRDRFARLLLIEGVADSIPRVTLVAPERDSVLREATGRLALQATVHDDLGLQRAAFEVVISSGEGERFTVRTQQVGARTFGRARDATLTATLELAALALGPGDVVHLRAVARDGHPLADREIGTSETRSFRIARPSEYDSIAVEPAPPPEVDKSLLSQRMLLMLTERLDARRPRITPDVLRAESRTLARDQGRLRQAVGDAVFQRLTGDAGGEHSHSADDGHDHGVEAIGGKLALSGVNAQGMLEEGDDAPVIAINKPLLEAYNAMWDAGRALEQAEPKAAIPFMRIALEAIERARAASRLYLRGRPPTVIIDLAKVRLVGKDTGAPVTRVARDALPRRSAAREARLLGAAALVIRDAAAARDSLAVLRIESLADAPAFADAVGALLEAFAGPPGTDVTEPFLRARRVLGGIERISWSAWSRGGPP